MNTWIEFVDRLSQAWLAGMSRACVEGGIALLIVWLACRLVARIPAGLKCWLWRLAYLKLLLSLLWATPINLPILRNPHPAPITVSAPRPPLAVSERDFAISAMSRDQVLAPVTRASRISPAELFVPVLLVAWALGAGGMLLWIVLQWKSASRLRRKAVRVMDERVVHECRGLSRLLGLGASVELLVSDSATSPLLLGILRPAVVLPRSFVEVPLHRLRIMLAHELAHVARRDLAWGLFAAVVEALFFFHPFVWLCRRESRLSQEMAADQAALELTHTSPTEYGLLLLDVAARYRAPTSLFVAGIVTSRTALERRLRTMNYLPRFTRLRSAVAAAAIALLVPVAVPPWKLVARAAVADQTLPAGRSASGASTSATGSATTLAAGANVMDFPAVISSADKVRLQPRGDGTLESFTVKEGDVVQKDQVVFRLSSGMEELQMTAAKKTLEEKNIFLKRKKEMRAANVISELELVEAQLDMEIATARLELAAREADAMIVRSPINGIIEFATVKPRAGEYVTRGTTLATVTGHGDVRAEFQLPQSLRPALKKGSPVELTIDAYPNEVFHGSISFISPEVNTATATARTVAEIANPKQHELDGMVGRLRMTLPTGP